ncbi:cyclic peptide export ABC transporter [Novosphingobium beihaiensis]|uniref:Cyclic peptide export ABC transporter n=1 Tax=Novosphingobium beihaiensis TaxID=2930389 RepID=A0ABT0BTJ4_9SPHN|nr:cyclic peptide export ABC transporter [Novosphingobium beihaiensis]MCJ2188288.1 cyclic peptide export ABC transporter [Novosphingobium beihaiensis]
MSLVLSLLRRFRWRIPVAMLLGAGGAVSGLALVAVINALVAGTLPFDTQRLGLMAALLVAVFACGFLSQSMLTSLGHRVVSDMRVETVKRIMDTGLERLDAIGAPALYATLAKDIVAVGQAFNRLPLLFANAIMLLSGFCYLAWLSFPLFAFSAGLIGAAAAVAYRWVLRMRALMMEVRATDDRLMETYRGAIEGRHELALNGWRRQIFHREDVARTAEHARVTETHADRYWALSLSWTSMLVLGVMAGIFVAGTMLGLPAANIAAFVLVLMFLRMPLNELVGTLPILLAGNVALARVEALRLEQYRAHFHAPLADGTPKLPADRAASAGTPLMELRGIVFEHPAANGEKGFRLGPVDLTIERGETVFIVGGNGSGKSTLMSILAGLRKPAGGSIRLSGRQITDAERHCLREQVSAVFSSPFLFERLVGPGGQLDEALAQAFLRRLRLSGKVSIQDSRLSDIQLSQGQRKRLALLSALVEQRPVLLLDEWAADQDPVFRRFFYEELLPELRAQGRTIIAISHDDRFFHVADRVLQCDAGTLSPWGGREAVRNAQTVL